MIKRIQKWLRARREVLLFASLEYYPAGGVYDFRHRGSPAECKAWLEANVSEFENGFDEVVAHLADPTTLEVLEIARKTRGKDGWHAANWEMESAPTREQ